MVFAEEEVGHELEGKGQLRFAAAFGFDLPPCAGCKQKE
jgi:hypothetical protein